MYPFCLLINTPSYLSDRLLVSILTFLKNHVEDQHADWEPYHERVDMIGCAHVQMSSGGCTSFINQKSPPPQNCAAVVYSYKCELDLPPSFPTSSPHETCGLIISATWVLQHVVVLLRLDSVFLYLVGYLWLYGFTLVGP